MKVLRSLSLGVERSSGTDEKGSLDGTPDELEQTLKIRLGCVESHFKSHIIEPTSKE